MCSDLPDTPLTRLAAAMLRAPHAFATDLSAAHVLGIPAPDDGTTYLGIRRGEPRPRSAGIRTREYVTPPATVVRSGIAVTAAAPLFVQLAGRLRLLDLVIAGDAMVRTGQASLDCRQEAADAARGRILSALERRGCPDLPQRLGDDWRLL